MTKEEKQKEARRIIAHNNYLAHREERLTRAKAYRNANLEKCRAYGRAYNEAHREENRARSKAYYQSHKLELKAKKIAKQLNKQLV